MNGPDFQKAFEEQNTRDYIASATLGTCVSIPLNLFCSIMDRLMYHDLWSLYFKARVISVSLVALAWIWHKSPLGRSHIRLYGMMWYISPLMMILWMIYAANDPMSPYYAGLNIVLLAVGLISPWTYWQNLLTTIFVLVMYVVVCLAMESSQPASYLINNTTFLVLTSVLVVSGSVANARQRLREFSLRWELDKNRRVVEESNRKLKEMDQIKSQFFANISHELRTPLTLLLAPLEALLHRFSRALDTETRDMLVTMHSNGMRLLKLINDLLDLVRLESGRMEVKREPVEVAEFVKGLASAARQVADDKRLRLETFVDSALGTVLGDRDKLEKVVLNLLFNALKFTPAGGRVELRAEKRGEVLALVVADTGMGISEKNMAHVFDRFWQADGSSTRKYQGAGIGLALVKELVEVQGGQVAVESQEGKGTTFTVMLAYQPSDPAQLPKPEAVRAGAVAAGVTSGTATSEEWLANLYRRAEFFPALTPLQESLRPEETMGNGRLPTILVADDEPDMRHFLKSQLSAHYRVLEAVDGQQAVEKASQFLPDIILLDMMMPEKDGLQACREIREHTPTQSIPIILLTARADEETRLGALTAGASDFLTKPFSSTELHVRIKNLVESYQYQRKVSKQNQVLKSTIEQLKDTEAQLVQTEKLASLGRMSAGIIHEINNPLNYATTGLFTLRNKGKYLAPDQQEGYHEILKDVEEGIRRVRTIVSDLRMFTHPDTESRDQVEVPEVVTAALRFLSNEWKDKVRIEQKLAEHQSVWANKNKLIHVLVNLLQNSLDALKAKSFADGQPTIWIEGRLESGKSILVVRDNGGGIESEHLDKIFDPFYTTKDVGEGMGLGLSICYRIVRECEGQISVRTEPGKFCEFALEFPAKGQQQM
jgi:signal transduction histidine kinase